MSGRMVRRPKFISYFGKPGKPAVIINGVYDAVLERKLRYARKQLYGRTKKSARS